jgi:hypothetical protein
MFVNMPNLTDYLGDITPDGTVLAYCKLEEIMTQLVQTSDYNASMV